MKILITGGNGFIGSYLTDELLKEHEVIVFDSFDRERLNPKLTFIKGDITSLESIREIHDIGGIIHLAAVSRVSDAEKDPAKCLSINVIGTTNILELAKRLKCWLILGSTIELPTNIYGLSKYFCELLAERYHKNHGLKILTLKFSSVYGSAIDNKDKLIPKLIAQALSNQEITIKNSQKYFDLIHIDDLINGICLAVKYTEKKEQFYNSICLCSGKQISSKKIAEEIIKGCGSSSKLTVLNVLPEEIALNDARKAEEILGFKAKIDFEGGIRKTIAEITLCFNSLS